MLVAAAALSATWPSPGQHIGGALGAELLSSITTVSIQRPGRASDGVEAALIGYQRVSAVGGLGCPQRHCRAHPGVRPRDGGPGSREEYGKHLDPTGTESFSAALRGEPRRTRPAEK